MISSASPDSYCKILEWDSDFFGQKIARLTLPRLTSELLAAAIAWCRAENIQCLYFLADSDHAETVRLAEDQGFRLVDLRITLVASLEKSNATAPDETFGPWIRAANLADLPVLKEMAGRLHYDSRFFFDEQLPMKRSQKLFEIWMEKSCRNPENPVLVAEEAGKIVGYVTCKKTEAGSGQIDLIAVDLPAQAKGLGTKLIRAALAWFKTQNFMEISVVTQGRNVRALRLYERSGFLIRAVQLWYHYRPETSVALPV